MFKSRRHIPSMEIQNAATIEFLGLFWLHIFIEREKVVLQFFGTKMDFPFINLYTGTVNGSSYSDQICTQWVVKWLRD